VLARYSLWGLAWLVLAGGFAIALTLIYAPLLKQLAPDWIVDVVLWTLWVGVFIPVVVVVGKPMLERLRGMGE
jgi:hypothetical protein